MDMIYMTTGRIELGVLANFTLDLDVADSMDFEIKASASGIVLEKGYFWYIPDTEYGGRIDDRKIDSANNTITYTGRTWRGILNSYIVEPSTGEAYLVVSGSLANITADRLAVAGVTALFHAGDGETTLDSFQFDRYTTLYKGLMKAAAAAGQSIGISWTNGFVVISYHTIRDFSDELEYSQDSGMEFTLAERSAQANHLICLGSGELEERMVVHLYRQVDGSTGAAKAFFGLDEITETLDYPSAESTEELTKSGTKRMDELAKSKEFSIYVDDLGLLIGDIVSARDRITDTTMKGAVENIIVKIRDGRASQEYAIGGADGT